MSITRDVAHYLIDERPVKVVVADGRERALALDWKTGRFVNDDWLQYAIKHPDELDKVRVVTQQELERVVAEHRADLAAQHVAAPMFWTLTGDARFPLKVDHDGREMRIRLGKRDGRPLHTLFEGDAQLASFAEWPAVWGRPGMLPAQLPSGPRDVEWFAVNDRPVKVVAFPNGGTDVFVFDFTTGGFVVDRSYWEHIHRLSPFKDVDTLRRREFDEIAHRLRSSAVAKRVTSPISWQATDDPQGLWTATVDGRELAVRRNAAGDMPYTLLAGGEEIADLSDWPEAWQMPGLTGVAPST